MRTPPHRHRIALRRTQQGVALLVAILLVALGTILAAAIAYENAMTARRGTSTFAFDEAVLVGQGAEALAAYGLRTIHQSDPTHLYKGQGWDKAVGPMEVVPGVTLEASLEDMQGRFNLNSLVKSDGTPDQVNVEAFTQLLVSLGLEPKWTGFIIDWIDADIVPQNPEGAEDSVYMGQTPPYRTANRYITSASELLALPGFGRDRYLLLAPHVTALPWNTKINTCTADGMVLDAYIGNGHSEFGAAAGVDANGVPTTTLDKNRLSGTGCSPTPQDLQKAFDPKIWQGASGKFGMTSSYFRLKSFITIGSTEFNLYSLLYEDTTGAVRPIQRSFTSN